MALGGPTWTTGHATRTGEREPLLPPTIRQSSDYQDDDFSKDSLLWASSIDAEELSIGSFSLEAEKRHSSSRRTRRCGPTIRMIVLVIILLFAGFVYYIWRREQYLTMPWLPDADSIEFSKTPLPPPAKHNAISQYALPLRTQGRNVIDTTGRRFKLHSVNWYGASDELFVPGGLDVRNRTDIAKTIKRLGFNSVRMPYADELVVKNPVIEEHLVSANQDLIGLRALDVLEATVTALTDEGIAVIINNHITTATWCCGANPCDSGWANDHLPNGLCPVKQTEEDWIVNWETVMKPYVRNPLVIGADLRNEVRGLWGTMPWKKWAAAAEKCGNRLLKMNPDWLMVVEGTESANDLSGAKRRPVKFDVDNKLVYSAHVYSWSGWGSMDGRFGQRDYASFAKTMRYNWGYLLEEETAPVWVGELGSGYRTDVMGYTYWKHLWQYLKEMDADFGYWAINPRKPAGNTRETYSLVKDDWETPVLDYRMKDMVELMQR